MTYNSSMRWASAESHDAWVYRHTAQDKMTWEEWKAKREAVLKQAQQRKIPKLHDAHVKAMKQKHLPKRPPVVSLQEALKIIEAQFEN